MTGRAPWRPRSPPARRAQLAGVHARQARRTGAPGSRVASPGTGEIPKSADGSRAAPAKATTSGPAAMTARSNPCRSARSSAAGDSDANQAKAEDEDGSGLGHRVVEFLHQDVTCVRSNVQVLVRSEDVARQR